jgi:hypothetical protein
MRTPRTTKAGKLHGSAVSGSTLELKVALVYEDVEMGRQGKQVFDLIAREVGGQSAARLTVWRFDFLRSAELTGAVNRQAEEADVIIVAPRNPATLPAHVQAWLERWPLRRKQGTGALVALFDPSVDALANSSDAALLLWRAAERAGMEFFYRKHVPAGKKAGAKPEESAKLKSGAMGLFAAPHPVYVNHQFLDWDE